MKKGFILLTVLLALLLASCDALTYAIYNPDTCAHGEPRKGKPRGKDWTDLKNHQ